jgi:hypothetical protein
MESVEAVFRNIADSLTAQLRQMPAVNASGPAMGYITSNETCVQVRWGWLAFPAALVALMILLFIAMLLETRGGEERDRNWKSSPLALMYHGLDQDTLFEHKHGGTNRVEGMIEDAEQLHMRLIRTEKGWKFMGVD